MIIFRKGINLVIKGRESWRGGVVLDRVVSIGDIEDIFELVFER